MYRAIDADGLTLDIWLCKKWDTQAAYTFVEDPSWFHKDMIVFDTVYAPRETKLMKVAKEAGVDHVLNGLGMMLEQGAEAFKLWTGEDMPVDYIRELLFSEDN